MILADRAKLSLNGHAIFGAVICQASCTVTGPGDISGASAGIFINGTTGTQNIRRVTLHDNVDGIGDQAGILILRDVVSSNNVLPPSRIDQGTQRDHVNNGLDGIHVSQGAVFTAVANSQAGLINNNSDLETVLVDSVLKGHPGKPQHRAARLLQLSPPTVVRTACDHSLGPGGSSWGVCGGD